MAIVVENGNVDLPVNDSSINNQINGHDQNQNPNDESRRSNGGGGGGGEVMDELQDLFSKLNPMAEEFVPNSIVTMTNHNAAAAKGLFPNSASHHHFANNNNRDFFPHAQPNTPPRRRFGQGRRKVNSRTNLAQREDIIRRTVYVSDIDHQVTEQQLAGLFVNCGHVVDCRICGDPNSVLRFAFIEFTDEDGAHGALSLSGTMLGYYPVKVLPSKTAIAPVNPTYLPRAESAIAALNCSGVILGLLPIRVSPSKTPVRPRAPSNVPMH
ncbi:hypothetical protein ACFE04_005458 [Oxalis oulophora]